jgi:transposase-like protein
VIVLAVRWYLRFGLSYRDVEELLAERAVQVDHVSVYRWVQRFTPLLADAARPCRHAVGDRWQVDETYVKVAGRWRYVYRAIDQFGQVIDVFVSARRDAKAARRFFQHAMARCGSHQSRRSPTTRRLPGSARGAAAVAWHRTDRYANNHIEADHGRLKARLGPMRGLKQDCSKACSMRASWAADSLGSGPVGPRLRKASTPPCSKRVCQTWALWRDTPSSRATSAWERPWANSSAARSRRASRTARSS